MAAVFIILTGIGALAYTLYPEHTNLIPYYITQVAYPIATIVTLLMATVIEPYMRELRELTDEIKKSSVQGKSSDAED